MKDRRKWIKWYLSGAVAQPQLGPLPIVSIGHHYDHNAGFQTLSLGQKRVTPNSTEPVVAIVVPVNKKNKLGALLKRLPGNSVPVSLFFGKVWTWAELLILGNPAAIESQEARGQSQLVESQQLPRKGIEALEKLGVKVIHRHGHDSLFCDVELPQGWTKRATDHSMWSELVDDKGQVVASIFYKAAFYDRDAFISVKGDYKPN